MTEPAATGSILVNASPEIVYRLVTDVAGMGAWAVENERNVWLGGATGAAVGARFRGHNRRGWRRWSTTATVVAAQPGHLFAFRVTSFGMPVSVWAYDVHPTTDGCEVTESTWMYAGPLLRWVLGPIGTGVPGRAVRIAENERNIARTLAALKVVAEASPPPPGPPSRP
jgi:uncharacterized protein YndB with AHSA1/START domain